MVSHKYTRERLYNLQYAPLSKVVPDNLYEEVFIGANSKAGSGGGKTFVASKTKFADVIGVKQYEKGGKEKGSDERKEKVKQKSHKEEAGESENKKYQNWENEKFSKGLRWGEQGGGPTRKITDSTPSPSEGKLQPRSHVDELFAGNQSSQPTSVTAPQPRQGGSKFMKHFKPSDEPGYNPHQTTPKHSGGTEQEIIKQFMGSASSVQTLDAASFEQQLIASAAVQGSPPPPTQGFVDAASLEKTLLQNSLSSQQPQQTVQQNSQSGTFDAASLEAQLLANVTGSAF